MCRFHSSARTSVLGDFTYLLGWSSGLVGDLGGAHGCVWSENLLDCVDHFEIVEKVIEGREDFSFCAWITT